jgi:hypothetical protein
MKRLTLSRFFVALGILFISAFLLALVLAGGSAGNGQNSIFVVVVVVFALALLIGAGNLTYGKNSHYAKAWDRIRPARSRPSAPETAVAPETAATEPDVPNLNAPDRADAPPSP